MFGCYQPTGSIEPWRGVLSRIGGTFARATIGLRVRAVPCGGRAALTLPDTAYHPSINFHLLPWLGRSCEAGWPTIPWANHLPEKAIFWLIWASASLTPVGYSLKVSMGNNHHPKTFSLIQNQSSHWIKCWGSLERTEEKAWPLFANKLAFEAKTSKTLCLNAV